MWLKLLTYHRITINDVAQLSYRVRCRWHPKMWFINQNFIYKSKNTFTCSCKTMPNFFVFYFLLNNSHTLLYMSMSFDPVTSTLSIKLLNQPSHGSPTTMSKCFHIGKVLLPVEAIPNKGYFDDSLSICRIQVLPWNP